ncbi:MAG TPA: tRNA epoxyqueuosine(34) reductase QueG [Gemmatimonadales bacterium]|nr:tRNA epoxyqueuosine(34) reductase QueG [Gemmatimonadales bacterium]
MISADIVKQWAEEAGFLACGITNLGPNAHADALDRWLAAGYGGTMRYIHRQAKKRKNPALADPEARSVVVVLDNYYYDDSDQNATPPKVAKYARGKDYHDTVGRRLEGLAERLREAGAGHTRCYVDAGPIPERELARRAGLGWIGKNAMLIRPGVGSFFFIGEILTDLELALDAPFETDHCGSCSRCIDACPTDAIVEPRVVDATRCISYLTIEQKGPIPDDLAAKMDGWVFGCDICNDVCPWNVRFAGRQGEQGEHEDGRGGLDGQVKEVLASVEQMTEEEEFERHFAGTPFMRPGLKGMQRNLRAASRVTRDP